MAILMKSFIKLGPCSTRAMFKKSPCGNKKRWDPVGSEKKGTLRQEVIGGLGCPHRLLEPRLRDAKELFGCCWRLNIHAIEWKLRRRNKNHFGIQGTSGVKIHFDSSAFDSSAQQKRGGYTAITQLSNQASSCCGSFHLIWARHSTFARPSDFMYIYLVMFERVLTTSS